MKKRFVGLVLVIATMLVFSTNIFASGCGNWEIYDIESPYCHDELCYKFQWWNGSWGQPAAEKRLCIRADNTEYWEYHLYTEWNGCCEYT